ncbi:hypothetical protein DM872_13945 [Pseudomonas taiwanensis]|nr:hypothetical protein [Pseudomonas taiwanensis]
MVQANWRKKSLERHFFLIFIALNVGLTWRKALQGAPYQRIPPQPRTSPMQALYQRCKWKFPVNLGRWHLLLGIESYKENRHAP